MTFEQLNFEIRTSKIYKNIRLLAYYVFQYKKRNKMREARRNGVDNKYAYLKKYQNIHKGERCFIVATGPSLNQKDLELVKNEYTIGVNGLCLKFEELNWQTNYFCISDEKAYINLHSILDKKGIIYFSPYKKSEKDVNCIYTPSDHYNCYMVDYSKKEFTNNIVEGFGEGNTVVIMAIQIAAFMGFSEIYLMGVDCNYNLPDNKKYFVDHGIRGPEQKLGGLRMIKDFEAIKQYEDKWNVKIYNASRGGMLEVFPRVDLDKVINNE